MDIIKRQIHVRNITNPGFVRFKFLMTQSMDNMGLLSDIDKIKLATKTKSTIEQPNNVLSVASSIQISNQSLLQLPNTVLGRPDNAEVVSIPITAYTDSKLERVRSYNADNPYIEGFDIRRQTYYNYLGQQITGVDRILNIDPDSDEITYTFDANRDIYLGTTGQTTGLLYTDYPADGIDLPEDLDDETTTTVVRYRGEGWNSTNTSSSAVIQEEYLLNIIQKPEVESDVFIDRGAVSVLDLHLRLSEIESLDHLTRYGNGFYNITKL